MENLNLIEIKNLYVSYYTDIGKIKALDGVDLNLETKRIKGLIGESGCGKTTLAKTILSILPASGRVEKGEILFQGKDLLKVSSSYLNNHIRGKKIAMIPQNPAISLNPLFTIGTQMEDLIIPKLFNAKRKKKNKIREMFIDYLKKSQLPSPENILKRYPHELSGGQLQRIFITIAMIVNPLLIIADEPTTALDVTVEVQILELLKKLVNNKSAVIYITHNLAVASKICDSIAVMYCGQLVESADKKSFFSNPAHPYSKKLLACLPTEVSKKIKDIPGSVPSLFSQLEGCRFESRCDRKISRCTYPQKLPKKEIASNHWVRCYNPYMK